MTIPDEITVALNDSLREFVAAELASGHFSSAGDVIHAALTLLQSQDRDRSQLEMLLAEGERSGAWQRWDFKGFLREVHDDDARREAA